MTRLGWFMMGSFWLVIIVTSLYLVYKTVVTPRQDDE